MFTIDQYVVYPAHGVGQITAIESVSSIENVSFYVIHFVRDKMTIRVPTHRQDALRALTRKAALKRALKELTHQRVKSRRIWHQREWNYREQLNSGDIVKLAELTRNLYITDTEQQSYSEREVYDAALLRLSDEVAAVTGWRQTEAAALIEEALATKQLPKAILELT